jgi:hypothetical protein
MVVMEAVVAAILAGLLILAINRWQIEHWSYAISVLSLAGLGVAAMEVFDGLAFIVLAD